MQHPNVRGVLSQLGSIRTSVPRALGREDCKMSRGRITSCDLGSTWTTKEATGVLHVGIVQMARERKRAKRLFSLSEFAFEQARAESAIAQAKTYM
jgi:hypothetical protein